MSDPAPTSGWPSAAPAGLAPTAPASRIAAVDTLRGVAVLGILLMNIVGMGLPFEAYDDPTILGGAEGWNLAAWFTTNLFFEGTMRALFSVLFGAGVLLFTGRDADKDGGVSVADAWYRRMIWLFIFGLVHAYFLLWPGDILYSYGLMGMFLFPFRRVAAARLFLLGAALLLAGAGFNLSERLQTLALRDRAVAAQAARARGESLPKEAAAAIQAWADKQQERKPSADRIQETIARTQSGYAGAFRERVGVTTFFRSSFHFRYDYFDILGMMFVGMALFKWGFLQASRCARSYLGMVVVGYGVGLAVNAREIRLIQAHDFSALGFSAANLTYDLGRLATMAGHIGVVMLLCQSRLGRRLIAPVAAAGRMALTNYILQTLITTTVFIGLGQFGRWERHQLYYLVAAIWILQLVASPLWLRHFRFGPLEWAWRALTYLHRPPFRVRPAPPAATAAPPVPGAET